MRRFSCAASFGALAGAVRKYFGLASIEGFAFQYIDRDQDTITVGSSEELLEAIREMVSGADDTLRLGIVPARTSAAPEPSHMFDCVRAPAAAPGFSAGGAAGGKRAKDTPHEAAGEAAKRPCGCASGAEGESAAGGASAAVARVEQPGRGRRADAIAKRKRDKARDVCTGASQKRITRRSGHEAQEAALVENILAGIRAGSAHCISSGIRDVGISIFPLSKVGFITNVGAKTIAPEIQSLVSLDLSGNQIGCEGLESMMRTIVRSTTLTSLALECNPLGDAGATILGDALKSNRSLTELRIYRCDIGVSGLNALAQGLEVNTKILSLPYFVPRLKTKAMAVTSSARSMTVLELRRELDAWGLDTDGPRDVLLRKSLLPRMQEILDRFSTPVASIKKSLARNERIVVEEKFTAFTMGVHARLGATSLVRMLADVSTPGEDANNPPQFDLLRSISKLVFK